MGMKITGTGFSSILRLFNGSGDALGGIEFAASSSIAPYMTFGASTVGTSSVLRVSNTTESSSSTTGSVIISGGLGISKKLFVGGTASFTGAISVPNPSSGSHAVNLTTMNNAISTVNTSSGTKLVTSIYDAFVISNTAALATLTQTVEFSNQYMTVS